MILDASAFITVLNSDGLDELFASSEIEAPDLLVPEVLNAFWKLERVGIPVPSTKLIFGLLKRIVMHPSIPFSERAAELARKIDHPVYDCLYLSLAEARGDFLITADRRLLNKLQKHKLRSLIRILEPDK